MLRDRFGRTATSLRISLIDRCNLRCSYCLPAAGTPWLPREELLSGAEVVRLATVAVRLLGVRAIRFSGGEPLLRPDLISIVRRCAALPSPPELALTTNAVGLDRCAEALVSAGLNRLNVSLDTVDRDTFWRLTRRDRLPAVLAGIQAAAATGLPIKLNAVLMRGVNDDQAPQLLRWALERGHELRFIEHMPLGAGHDWRRADLVTGEQIRDSLAGEFVLTPSGEARGDAPARRWLVNGGPATVGFISSVTEAFCAACSRTRLTADGAVRDCLFAHTETDLRGPLRAGASDAELADLWRAAMWGKAAGHGVNRADFRQPDRPMSAIGG